MAVPERYWQRISADAQSVFTDEKFPLPDHVELRRYALEQAEILAQLPNEKIISRWRKREMYSKAMALRCRANNPAWRNKISQNAAKFWAQANLDFPAETITFADPENGHEMANYILQGVPTHDSFPRTNLFRSLSEEQLRRSREKQEQAKKDFKVRERSTIPEWVPPDKMKAAFDAFLAKAREPLEVFCPFEELIDPVFYSAREYYVR